MLNMTEFDEEQNNGNDYTPVEVPRHRREGERDLDVDVLIEKEKEVPKEEAFF